MGSKAIRASVAAGLILLGGLISWKFLKALGHMTGLWRAHPAQAAVNFGPYPYPQDTHLYWHDPSALSAKAQEISEGKAVRERRSKALEIEGQDQDKALDRLFEGRRDPEGSQALFHALRELASGGEAPIAEGKAGKPLTPVFRKEGGKGIASVARIAQKLAEVRGTDRMGRFDQLLLEDSIRLMGFYGADPRSKQEVPAKGDPKPKGDQIDPVTRGVLRQFLQVKDGAIQALACRALGQLGDVETAKEIISHPNKYPSASISDFGPEAVELFRKAQSGKMAAGAYTDADMWQSLRLRPKDQEVAEYLAGMGDPGAAMAAGRNWVQETMHGSVDQHLYRRLDILLRFPGTPQARGALEVASFGSSPNQPSSFAIYQPYLQQPGRIKPDSRLTTMALLALLDREFAQLFSGKPFRAGTQTPKDLPCIQRFFRDIAAMQELFLDNPTDGAWQRGSQLSPEIAKLPNLDVTPESKAQVKVLLDGVRRVYLKHFRKDAFGWVPGFDEHLYEGPPTPEDKERVIRAWRRGMARDEERVLVQVCWAAHHLGLPQPDWFSKKYIFEGKRKHDPREGAWR